MKFCKKLKLSEYVFGFSFIIVVFSFIAFYLIDLRNIFGLRDLFFSVGGEYFFFTYYPFFFHHWGRNSGFAEILQFLMLGGSAIISSFIAGIMYSKNKKLFAFWAIMSVAFVLMLLEDAGNIRHVLMSYVQAVFNEPDQGIMGTSIEFLYFSFLATIPLYALIRYWKSLKEFSKTKIYLLIGFSSYAVAQSLSFLGTAFEGLLEKNFYNFLGGKFYEISLFLGDKGLLEKWENYNSDFIKFFLMDSLIEENIELIGAGAFFAAAISFLIYLKNRNKEKLIEN